MKLHGREDDMKLLRSKLLELKKRGKEDSNNSSSTDTSLPELIFISGISGTGKSALVMKGVRDPAQKMV
jgi:excinuclease UvrABC ATPase subunit